MAEDPAVKGGRIGGPKGGKASLYSEKVSAAQIQLYLKGIHYPASKQNIINTARSNNAPENVMDYLNRLPDREYGRANDVEKEFSKMKQM